MRRVAVLSILMMLPLILSSHYENENYEGYLCTYYRMRLYALIEAIVHVESRGDSLAFNRHENAAGALQIRPIMVREANRIVGRNEYSLADRWSVKRSIELFVVVQSHYNPRIDFEDGARLWNGGRIDAKGTDDYWKKVKGRLRW